MLYILSNKNLFYLRRLNWKIYLKNEKSPYLKQHENNPVHWYAWGGQENFNKAKELKKPIFLSVGYASCHWCHVMAHESFEDKNTAAVMNENLLISKLIVKKDQILDNVFQKSLVNFNRCTRWLAFVYVFR